MKREVLYFEDVFNTMTYPAGEPHVTLKPGLAAEMRYLFPTPRNFIIAQARDWNGIMKVVIADEVLKNNGVHATFVIPYLPFSRHDRRNTANDSSPVPWVLDLLKNVDCITIDPHSDVAGVMPHFSQREVVLEFSEHGIFDDNPVVVIPDAGAAKKAYSWIPQTLDHVQALKNRNVKTGELSGFQVIDAEMVHNRNVVIIDDICDGGGTFIGLARELMSAGCAGLRLGVTHGLFTKGLHELLSYYSEIYTLDTHMCTWKGVTVVSTKKIVQEGAFF